MLNSFVVENNGGKINGENYGNNIGDLWGGRSVVRIEIESRVPRDSDKYLF